MFSNPPSVSPSVLGRRLRLLLVEDNDDHALLVASLARRALEAQPLVERVATLEEAFARVEAEPPDLALLDLGLAESRGLETLDRALERFPKLPIVVLTASSDLATGEEAVRKGALDFVSKDEISERALSRSIRYSLERHRQRQALARAIRDLEAFAHVAAHDLKSPLCTIQSVCGIVASRLEETQKTQRDRDLIEVLRDSAARATQLVDGLLRFCKLGAAAVRPARTSLEELADETIAALDDSIRRTGARVERGSLPEAMCDRDLMAHVFQNLLSNALKFCGDKPPRARISGRAVDGEIEIAVEDEGVGIAEEDRERIFEPFLRLQGGPEGSGLGLSICQRVIDAHGGRIWVESTAGEGSRFVARLPG